MAGLRVLVTRPEPGASETAKRLTALGHVATVLPLTRIVPLPMERLPEGPFDAIVLTSASAIRHAPAALVATIARLPAYVVGERTARAAKTAGLVHATFAGPTVAELAGMLPGVLPTPARLLYLAGRIRTGALEHRLRPLGHEVCLVETYDTEPDPENVATAARLWANGDFDMAIVHSGESARLLADIALRAGVAPSPVRFVAISLRAAEPLVSLGLAVECAARPDEAAIMELVQRR